MENGWFHLGQADPGARDTESKNVRGREDEDRQRRKRESRESLPHIETFIHSTNIYQVLTWCQMLCLRQREAERETETD